MRYVVKNSKIVHQYIDGETIILNLENGTYYSLLNTAALVWELLMMNGDDQQVMKALSTSKAKINETLTRRFIDGLCEEGLVIPKEVPPLSNDDFQKKFLSGSEKVDAASWLPPAFEKFTDIQGFLLVDPIHDIEEQGWPAPKTDD